MSQTSQLFGISRHRSFVRVALSTSLSAWPWLLHAHDSRVHRSLSRWMLSTVTCKSALPIPLSIFKKKWKCFWLSTQDCIYASLLVILLLFWKIKWLGHITGDYQQTSLTFSGVKPDLNLSFKHLGFFLFSMLGEVFLSCQIIITMMVISVFMIVKCDLWHHNHCYGVICLCLFLGNFQHIMTMLWFIYICVYWLFGCDATFVCISACVDAKRWAVSLVKTRHIWYQDKTIVTRRPMV